MSEFYLRCEFCGNSGFSVVVDEAEDVARYECRKCGGGGVERGREI